MSVALRVGVVLVAVVIGAVALNVLGPTKPDVEQYNEAVLSALTDAAINEASAEGAPQQAVVNGWLARDLAKIEIEQNSALLDEQAKTNQLLFVTLVTLAVGVAILAGPRGAHNRSASGPPVEALSSGADGAPDQDTPSPRAFRE
jgi:hypothetical protein